MAPTAPMPMALVQEEGDSAALLVEHETRRILGLIARPAAPDQPLEVAADA